MHAAGGKGLRAWLSGDACRVRCIPSVQRTLQPRSGQCADRWSTWPRRLSDHIFARVFPDPILIPRPSRPYCLLRALVSLPLIAWAPPRPLDAPRPLTLLPLVHPPVGQKRSACSRRPARPWARTSRSCAWPWTRTGGGAAPATGPSHRSRTTAPSATNASSKWCERVRDVTGACLLMTCLAGEWRGRQGRGPPCSEARRRAANHQNAQFIDPVKASRLPLLINRIYPSRQDHHCVWMNNCVGFHNCESRAFKSLWVTMGWYIYIVA